MPGGLGPDGPLIGAAAVALALLNSYVGTLEVTELKRRRR